MDRARLRSLCDLGRRPRDVVRREPARPVFLAEEALPHSKRCRHADLVRTSTPEARAELTKRERVPR